MLKENKLNDLDLRRWAKFVKSHVYLKNIETNIQDFIEFFTKKNDYVLDPFMKDGYTLIAANKSGRNAIGLEKDQLNANKAANKIRGMKAQTRLIADKFIKTRQLALLGDALEIDELWKKEQLPNIDFVICFTHKDITELCVAFKKIKPLLKFNKYLVIITKNKFNDGFIPYTWSLARALEKLFTLKGEKILTFETKTKPFGYGIMYTPMISHYTALIFQNDLS